MGKYDPTRNIVVTRAEELYRWNQDKATLLQELNELRRQRRQVQEELERLEAAIVAAEEQLDAGLR